jgi:hypothetical protein
MKDRGVTRIELGIRSGLAGPTLVQAMGYISKSLVHDLKLTVWRVAQLYDPTHESSERPGVVGVGHL